MPTTITGLIAEDLRFPTSRTLDGSDAMHPDPDYSLAYCVLTTDRQDGAEGHGFTFTIGRGTEVCAQAIEALRPLVVGRTLESFTSDMAGFWRLVTGDSQLRWLGPEKGVIHLATAAVVNAVWDLWAKSEGKPLWRLLADLTPEQTLDCIDWRYLSDALTRDEALEILHRNFDSRAERIHELEGAGYPAYTTSAGWLGYDDDKLRALCRKYLAAGWDTFKIKVGRDLDDDIRRCRILREEIGPDRRLMVDANQIWDVPEAIRWMESLAEFKPWFLEEPTSPDDILGHAAIARAIAPIKVATGEHGANRVMFKQLLQAEAIGICQIDACRLGGVNEVLAVLLLAAHFDVPVCPHAGGVGLCEAVQHLAIYDYIAVSASLDERVCEYADHLHEHFIEPVDLRNGRYVPPKGPGYVTMIPDSRRRFAFPGGAAWIEG